MEQANQYLAQCHRLLTRISVSGDDVERMALAKAALKEAAALLNGTEKPPESGEDSHGG